MIRRVDLMDLLHRRGLSRRDLMLICLGVEPGGPKSVATLRALAVDAGITAAKDWNLSAVLGGLAGLAVRTGEGWDLNHAGKQALNDLVGGPPAPAAASSLRDQLKRIASNDARAFVEESVGCIEHGHYRAAVVLSWIGAMALLYDHIVAHQLAAFNLEARHRDAKWRDAKTADHLARMGESDCLHILEAIGVIGKNVRVELEGCLKLRNGCGHPNTLKVAEHRVNSHVEVLVLNVYSHF